MALLGSTERLGAGRSLCSVMTEHDNNASSSETRLRMRETAHHVISLIQVNISGHIRNSQLPRIRKRRKGKSNEEKNWFTPKETVYPPYFSYN